MALPPTIKLYHTAKQDTPPPLLTDGEMAAELSTETKVWIGDGSNNRLLFSTNPVDAPLFAPGEGPPGANGVNAYTSTTTSFTVPPVGQTVSVTLADASWVVVGQFLWVGTAADGTNAGPLQVTAKTGNTVTLLNPPQSTPATGGGVIISTTPPASPTTGMLWQNDDQCFIYAGATLGWEPFVKVSRWTLQGPQPSDGNWYDIAYGAGLFVAVAQGAAPNIMTSPDGVTWTTRTTPLDGAGGTSIAFGNNTFVTVRNPNGAGAWCMTSPDGINWTAHNPPPPYSPPTTYPGVVGAVRFANGLFIVGLQQIPSVDAGVWLMTSPDGITWTPRTVPALAQYQAWRPGAYGAGVFVCVAPGGVMTSPDAVTWTKHASPDDAQTWTSVAFGNGVFAASSNSKSNVMTSPDGINWTLRRFPQGYNIVQTVTMTFANGLFIAGSGVNASGMFDRIVISRDGVNWLVRRTPTDATWWGFAYGNGVWVGVAYSTFYNVITSQAP